ncbi:hypothetical protein IJH24_01135 [Candidatus Saccharibacteria bacterium]|nr:hypothetical protein [Candidatus Saccharibacteria bacterium]
MEKGKMKAKKGAASFYIVAFSTLILVIIAASFTAVVLSEMARSANDDLSQSAYDSALAGIEDAKLAFYNYQKCLSLNKKEGTIRPDNVVECEEIIYWVNHPDDGSGCDMVAKILGRISEDDSKEVMIEESSGGAAGGTNNLQQAYTCVKINKTPSDYRATLTEANTTKVVQVKLGTDEKGNQIHANEIDKVVVNWFAEEDRRSASNGRFQPRFSNISGSGSSAKVLFPALKSSDTALAVPPMISVSLVQTAKDFLFDDFTVTATSPARTNRGTVFLVPTDDATMASGSLEDNYVGIYNQTEKKNIITKSQMVKSNNRAVKNLPLVTYCDVNISEFACSATMELPNVINGEDDGRSDETFTFVVSLPYGQPDTSFSLEFYCKSSRPCGKEVVASEGGSTTVQKPVTLDGMQIEIDSTGRANNLYRRVGARLDVGDSYFPYPLYALELLGSGDNLLEKVNSVTCEYQSWSGFGPTC